MAEKQKNTKNKSTSNRGVINKYWLSLIAFIGIGCIAISLLLTLIFKGRVEIAGAFNAIGQVIAYIICIIMAFYWVNSHRHIAWIVCYVVFVVTIVVLFILTI